VPNLYQPVPPELRIHRMEGGPGVRDVLRMPRCCLVGTDFVNPCTKAYRDEDVG
jgi:hypothetical protein